MEQFELFHVESPCRSICRTSKTGYCVGCLRSRDERFNWLQMTDAEKRETIQRCKVRWQKLIKAREDKLASKSDSDLPYGMKGEDIQPPLSNLEL